jgi:FHS family glucose/mannose:H+ symporter-like MFS transporter
MHAGLLLAGLGTALLGPILPLLATRWHLVDSQSGLLMAAKFSGAFLGGVSVTRHLERSLIVGFAAAAVGFFGFAVAPDWAIGAGALALGGFGIGRIITATNILAGRAFTRHRGSALALLNFSFSAGAMLSAVGAAWLLPRFALRGVLQVFAAAFAAVGLWTLFEARGAFSHSAPALEIIEPTPPGTVFGGSLFVYYAGLLFLYGGLETCLSGWLTTYALRYGERSFALSEYTTLLLWLSLTVGRAASSALMLRVPERTLQRIGLAASAACVAALGLAHGGAAIAIVAILLGLSLSPFFPATFALLMAERPAARQAGLVVAVSGLGAAALPWLMGVVSTRTGSLQIALVLPLGAAVGLLGMSFLAISAGLRASPARGRSEA